MCGIVGLALGSEEYCATYEILEALFQLQHRGQDAFGLSIVSRSRSVSVLRQKGLLTQISSAETIAQHDHGVMGLGHVRYKTSGSLHETNSQPLSLTGSHEIYLAHNGQVEVPTAPQGASYEESCRTDSHHILKTFSDAMERPTAGSDLRSKVLSALSEIHRSCTGAFACVGIVDSCMLVGFRDAYGLKPLILGKRADVGGTVSYIIASESVALEKLGYSIVRDVAPGEAIIIDRSTGKQRYSAHQVAPLKRNSLDVFELIYFARPEAVINGISVHECRKLMGHALGRHIARIMDAAELMSIDAIIPIPESGNISALALAQILRIPLQLGFHKNGYCNRSFIMPDARSRLKTIVRKLSAVRSEFDGKNLILVDDSIVRGNTSREVVRMARNAGARKIVFASCSPAIKFNHIYGIDLADEETLVANNRCEEQVAREIGADRVVYLPVQSLVDQCLKPLKKDYGTENYEMGIFTGVYTTI
ncbi:hypothetical protein B5807_04027 [Epicoccum nigrum]|uniref:Amidophosphoribosyltransferase n=1 Tax=Epicoccum nigrum TaxID=105696 RepID=A0A1Y2M8C6_EPING|nr:hypothetical protein B5807_04027 [Epicoccum nigrum]